MFAIATKKKTIKKKAKKEKNERQSSAQEQSRTSLGSKYFLTLPPPFA
jgi:hypothetical protein